MALAKVEVRNERFFTQMLESENVVIQGHYGTDVSLNIDAGQIASLTPQGHDLVIRTVTGETIVLHGFYAHTQDGKPNRLFVSDDGAIAQVDTYNTYSVNYFQAPSGTESLVFTTADFEMPVGLLAAAGVGVLGGGAALAFSGGDDDVATPTITVTRQNSDGTLTVSGTGEPNSTMTVRFPDGSTETVKVAPDGNYGPVRSETPQTSGDVIVTQSGTGAPTQTANESFIDEVAPSRPVGVQVTPNDDGTISVSGTGEPGSTVTLVLPSGETITDIEVSADGTFGPIRSEQNQPDGDVIVTQTDAAGNVSSATANTYEDDVAPTAPVITTVEANEDGTVAISGRGEPGATIEIVLPSGEILANVEVGVNGLFGPVTSTENQPSGQVSATQTDAEGNTSTSVEAGYVDEVAPTPLFIDQLTPNPDGTITVAGVGEPGSIVEITMPSGEVISGIPVDEDGSFGPVTSAENQPTGTITLTQTDEAGNLSEPTGVIYVDGQPPLAPDVDVVSANPDGTLTISGRGEPGATIELTLPSGELIRDIIVSADGTFGPVTSIENQPTGEVIATQTDDAGNTSGPGSQSYRDATPPEAPTFDSVQANDDGTLTISGRGEPGAIIEITLPSGETISSVEVGENGLFGPVTSLENQPSGTISATQTDEEGNTSSAGTQAYADATIPLVGFLDEIIPNPDGTVTIVGTGEPNATVDVTLPSGEIITGIPVAENGRFGPITSTENQPSGTVTVVQTDEAGNVSEAFGQVYVDGLPPEAPFVDVVSANADGTVTISGRGEPGATIELTLPSGEVIRNVPVANDGTFGPVSSVENQPTGDVVAVQTDDAGNSSNPGAQTYRDATPPEAPTIGSVLTNEDGTLTISGRGEPGAIIEITLPSGETISNIEVGANGVFGPVTSVDNQPSGTISASQTDAEGNTSSAGTQPYTDTTVPLTAFIDEITLNPDGTITLSGVGEPNATIDITLPSGEIITGIPVPENGRFGPVTSTENQPSGTITLVQTDEAGNVSEPFGQVYSDALPPEAPTIDLVTANADGTIDISGRGEPGATIELTLPSGEVIRNVPVANDGTFGPVTSVENQPTGDVIAVQTDDAGNASAPGAETYRDTTAPEAPTFDSVLTNEDGTLTISGRGEPGAIIELTLPSGETISSIEVGSNGIFGPVTSVDNQPAGSISARQTDAEGNTSPIGLQPYTDGTGPLTAFIDEITLNPDGTITVSGVGEPDATIDITLPSGEIITGIPVPQNGRFGPVTSAENQPSGIITLVQTDEAGNVSEPFGQVFTDELPPQAPRIDLVTANADGTIDISGRGEPGATIELTLPSGEVIRNVPVANDGTFGPVSSVENQPTGDVIAVQTDEAGNASAPGAETYRDATAPQAPTFDTVTANSDGTMSVTGRGEPGASVTIVFPSGETITNVVVGTNGIFGPVVSTENQPSGNVSASQTDAEGNTSASASQGYTDSTSPQSPSFSTITQNSDGTLTVAGSAEPGSTVDVTFPSGETATNIAVASNGTWGPIISSDVQTSGLLSASQTDAEGNTSSNATVSYTDATPPAAPELDTITGNANGTVTISGTGEPGATVDIFLPSGETLTNVPVASDGTFGPVTSNESQPSGQIVASQTDVAGNVSATSSEGFTDAAAPAAPNIDTITPNNNGTVTVSGTGEPSATVDITLPSGEIINNVVVASNGRFGPVTSTENQPSGTISATQTDAEGNTSAADNEPYTDNTAPSAPSIDTVITDPNGSISILGTAEPNATVEITMPSGQIISNIAVAADGSFGPVISAQNQPDGFISATQTDPANNTSPAETRPYTDPNAVAMNSFMAASAEPVESLEFTAISKAADNSAKSSSEDASGSTVDNNYRTFVPALTMNEQNADTTTEQDADLSDKVSTLPFTAVLEASPSDAVEISKADANENSIAAPSGTSLADNALVFDSGSAINIDLSTIDNTTIPDIELVDITGDSNNILTLTAADLLDLSNGTDELIVLGDTGDTVDANGGFSETGTTRTINEEVYDVYVSGSSTLIVHEDVTVLI